MPYKAKSKSISTGSVQICCRRFWKFSLSPTCEHTHKDTSWLSKTLFYNPSHAKITWLCLHFFEGGRSFLRQCQWQNKLIFFLNCFPNLKNLVYLYQVKMSGSSHKSCQEFAGLLLKALPLCKIGNWFRVNYILHSNFIYKIFKYFLQKNWNTETINLL